nr:unnamed protein product [Haemonchus contortus]
MLAAKWIKSTSKVVNVLAEVKSPKKLSEGRLKKLKIEHGDSVSSLSPAEVEMKVKSRRDLTRTMFKQQYYETRPFIMSQHSGLRHACDLHSYNTSGFCLKPVHTFTGTINPRFELTRSSRIFRLGVTIQRIGSLGWYNNGVPRRMSLIPGSRIQRTYGSRQSLRAEDDHI